jgi:hypothetical protein
MLLLESVIDKLSILTTLFWELEILSAVVSMFSNPLHAMPDWSSAFFL